MMIRIRLDLNMSQIGDFLKLTLLMVLKGKLN